MNYNRLQQDHPCVINYIRSHYLKKPSPPNTPLKLDYPDVKDPSDGQPQTIMSLLKNKVCSLSILFLHNIYIGLYTPQKLCVKLPSFCGFYDCIVFL